MTKIATSIAAAVAVSLLAVPASFAQTTATPSAGASKTVSTPVSVKHAHRLYRIKHVWCRLPWGAWMPCGEVLVPVKHRHPAPHKPTTVNPAKPATPAKPSTPAKPVKPAPTTQHPTAKPAVQK
jgi:hypothetical protein